MFLETIVEFKGLIQKVLKRQDEIEARIRNLTQGITTTALQVTQTDEKFEACAKGFYQIKDAMEVLLENLDESSGKLTEMTWNS